MPPPWSDFPLTALNATLTSTSLYCGPSATQRLNIGPGLSAVWARAKPDLDGAVGSATAFQILPSPLPVLSACQPVGTVPTSSLPKRKLGALSWASTIAPVSASSASTLIHRIVRSPLKQGEQRNNNYLHSLFSVHYFLSAPRARGSRRGTKAELLPH